MITHGETPPPPHEAKDVVVDGIPVQIAPSVSEETANQRLRRRGMLGRCLIGGYFLLVLLVILVTFLPEHQQRPLEVTIYVLSGALLLGGVVFLTRMCLTTNWKDRAAATFGRSGGALSSNAACAISSLFVMVVGALASTWAAASLALFGIWKLFLEDEHSCPDIGTCLVFIVLVPYRFVVIVCPCWALASGFQAVAFKYVRWWPSVMALVGVAAIGLTLDVCLDPNSPLTPTIGFVGKTYEDALIGWLTLNPPPPPPTPPPPLPPLPPGVSLPPPPPPECCSALWGVCLRYWQGGECVRP
mmetsp:Transcript_27692/g.90104  ORF Transcript_27692/g.90104 Transcript_27692/m.90104 type:complete len:301 (+) Transcript_27692:37-939(+)